MPRLVPGALLDVASCGRCGWVRDAPTTQCARCGAGWAAGSDSTFSPLAGARLVTTAARVGLLTLDIGLVAAVVALIGLGVSTALGGAAPTWVVVAIGVAALVAQLITLLLLGRTWAHWVLRRRTVDARSGTPLGLRRWSGLPTSVTADLAHGRDPAASELQPIMSGGTWVSAAAEPAGADGGRALPYTPSDAPSGAEPRPSVGIVLQTGERHEIHRSLVVGRSPVRPAGQPDGSVLAWPDLSRRLDKTHLLLEWSGTALWVTDLHSSAGTVVTSPDGNRLALVAGVAAAVEPGWSIECGGHRIKVVRGA